jgi:hypothetical protein
MGTYFPKPILSRGTGQRATWARVERTQMHLTQDEFYKTIIKRAYEVSAACQYQNLSYIRRAHVDRLIYDRRQRDRSAEWKCVYSDGYKMPSKAPNALNENYETISVTVILRK